MSDFWREGVIWKFKERLDWCPYENDMNLVQFIKILSLGKTPLRFISLGDICLKVGCRKDIWKTAGERFGGYGVCTVVSPFVWIVFWQRYHIVEKLVSCWQLRITSKKSFFGTSTAGVGHISAIALCLSSNNRVAMWCAGEWSVTVKIPPLTCFAVLNVTQGSVVNVYIRVGSFPTTAVTPGYRIVSSVVVW